VVRAQTAILVAAAELCSGFIFQADASSVVCSLGGIAAVAVVGQAFTLRNARSGVNVIEVSISTDSARITITA